MEKREDTNAQRESPRDWGLKPLTLLGHSNLSAKALDLDLSAKAQGSRLKSPTLLDHLNLSAEAQDLDLNRYQS